MGSDTVIHLEDDNKAYEVVAWQYTIQKEEKKSHENASANPRVATCTIVLKQEGAIKTLTDWGSDTQLKKRNLYISITPKQSKGRDYVIELVDVLCIGYSNHFKGVELKLLAGGMKQGQSTVDSHWKVSPFSSERTAATDTREEEEEKSTVVGFGKDKEISKPKTALPKLKQPKSLIDVPNVPIPKKNGGIIYPNAPKMPKVPKSGTMKMPKDIFSIPDGPINVDTKGIHKDMKSKGVIFPNAKVPKLSDAAKKHIPKDMQGVITDHPEDVLKDANAEVLRQDVAIAATNPKKGKFMTKALSAGKQLLAKGIPVIAIGGMAYSTYKSGKKAVKDIEKAGKWIKKRTSKAKKPAPTPAPAQLKATPKPAPVAPTPKKAPIAAATPKSKATSKTSKTATTAKPATAQTKAKTQKKATLKTKESNATAQTATATATSEVASGTATAVSSSKSIKKGKGAPKAVPKKKATPKKKTVAKKKTTTPKKGNQA